MYYVLNARLLVRVSIVQETRTASDSIETIDLQLHIILLSHA